MWLCLCLMINLGAFVTPPFDKQIPFLESCINPNAQYVAAFCGLQAGKTIAESDGGYASLYGENPIMLPVGPRGKTPMEVWLISKSYGLAQALFETFKWRTPPEIWASDKDLRQWGLKRDDRFTHYLLPRNNCEDKAPIRLRVRTASNPDEMRATPTLGLALCDEFARWKPKSWQNLQGRALVARTKFIGGTTTNGKNFAFRDVAIPGGYGGRLKTDESIDIHAWTSADNPHADKKHIERLRRIFGREYAKQELEGLFTDAIGYVFGEFDRTTMMVKAPSDDPDDYEQVTGGIDPGWTDPFAACVWAKYKGDGRFYQLFELYEQRRQIEDFAGKLLFAQGKWGVEQWQTDKRKPTEIDRLRRCKVKAVPNIDIHGEDDRRTIPIMLSIFQGLMQADKIRIMKDHEYTADEFERYHYKDQSDTDDERNTNDIPVDWSNHLMDAGRYALCAVCELPNAKPRYRQGPDGVPRELSAKVIGKPVQAYTTADYIAMQDKKMDAVARHQSAARGLPRHISQNRLRVRGAR